MKNIRKFVIQKHTRAGEVHWDLMLETGPVLETYRLGLPPDKLLQKRANAVKIFDHPSKFLTYEGSVNKGKGSVKIAETGTYRLLSESENCRQLQLNGRILKGKFTLIHIAGEKWQFQSCEND